LIHNRRRGFGPGGDHGNTPLCLVLKDSQNMTDIAQELRDLDVRRKRWMSRLTRAHTAIKDLDQKRQRLLKKQQVAADFPELRQASKAVVEKKLSTEIVAAPQGVVAEAVQVLDDNDLLPGFLRRGQAAQKAVDDILATHSKTVDVDKLKAERKAKEKAERSKMPLVDRDAMAAIRRKKK